MQTIKWQRPPNPIESKKSLIKTALVCLFIGGSNILKDYSKDTSDISLVGILLVGIGIYWILKHMLVPSVRKAPDIIDCSLVIVGAGLIYKKIKETSFIFFKDINLINSNSDKVVLHIDKFAEPSASTGLEIPVSALNEVGKENFINQIILNLPAENKTRREIQLISDTQREEMETTKTKKQSWFWIYSGLSLVVIFLLALLTIIPPNL